MRALLAALLLTGFTASAQTPDAPPGDDVPLDAYLVMLGQIAPSAREGAEVYAAAFRSRCGRALRSIELRRAVSEGNGDATLMALIRAAQLKDAAATRRLSQTLACPGG